MELKLAGTRVTDAGLKHLAQLSKLDRIDLGDPRITGAGLEYLAPLSKLAVLNLGKCHRPGQVIGQRPPCRR